MIVSKPITRVAYSVAVIFLLLAGGATVFHYLERWDWLDSVYFAVVSLTTVGYGDLVPQHKLTRLFLIFYLLVGVATVLYALTNIARYYLEERELHFRHHLARIKKISRRTSARLSNIPKPPTAH